MTRYDRAVTDLVTICLRHAGFTQQQRACVVRDLRGCVRLVVESGQEALSAEQRQALEQNLEATLEGYFRGPILWTDGDKGESRVARAVLDLSTEWPPHWVQDIEEPFTGARQRISEDIEWVSHQRFLAKQAWLSREQTQPAWPLNDHTPPIVAAYSFKGGVGRTTLVASLAWRLAEEHEKRVLVVDLDLEAPGVAHILGVEGDGPGALDLVVDHIASGSLDAGQHARQSTLPTKGQIQVVGAGTLGRAFLEKLGRLDFVEAATDPDAKSPVEDALRSLLASARARYSPDIILLDARSGLHDLSGLSLSSLAHVELLVSRNAEQSLEGLALTLDVLASRRDPRDLRVMLVQNFVPLDPAVAVNHREQMRDRCYELVSNAVYQHLPDDDPAVDDSEAPHYPLPISTTESLTQTDRLGEQHRAFIFGEQISAIYERLLLLCSPD